MPTMLFRVLATSSLCQRCLTANVSSSCAIVLRQFCRNFTRLNLQYILPLESVIRFLSSAIFILLLLVIINAKCWHSKGRASHMSKAASWLVG